MLKECTDDNYNGLTEHAQRVYGGLLLWGDSACPKSVQRTITMGSKCMLNECTEAITMGSQCMLKESTEGNYYGVTVHAQRVYRGL